MKMVNEHFGNRLLHRENTSFANINASKPVWWININPSKFKSDLHLLLAKEGDGGLIWLRIKGNAFPDVSKVFRVRQDNSSKGCIDLEHFEQTSEIYDRRQERWYGVRLH